MTTSTTVEAWLTGRLPQEWFTGPVRVTQDRDEIAIVGPLAAPETAPETSGDDSNAETAARGRITQFREDTRERRIQIARELEHRTGRTISWGAEIGDVRVMFTTLAAPVMTRLRQPERQVLDTLVDAGVARSRSDALGWCVRLVAAKSDPWLTELRAAMEQVERVRSKGPAA